MSIKLTRIQGLLDENIVSKLNEIVSEGFRAVDPTTVVKRVLHIEGDVVRINSKTYSARRIHIIGFGKASLKMLEGVLNILGERVCGGVIITPSTTGKIHTVHVLKGDHPYPGENTLKSSLQLIEYLESSVERDDVVLVLISGGGSSLFEIPEDDLTLEDIADTTRKLMLRGVDIYELNTVRKHLSKVKGGKLLKYIKGRVISLIISDVVGDDVSTIASGPTSPDQTTFKDVYNILVKRGVWSEISPRVKLFVERGLSGLVEETIKPGDLLLNKVNNYIVASNTHALIAMEEKARNLGYNTMLLTPYLTGEAREVAKFLASVLKSISLLGKPVKKPAVILAGGETTVTVRGGGRGGRNQELCLALSIELRGTSGITALCIASDGIDGNSPAAGALVMSGLYEYSLKKGLIPEEYLEENNSYEYFNKLGLAVYTGPTGINVSDFFISIVN
jgi:glycerate 2-kinase